MENMYFAQGCQSKEIIHPEIDIGILSNVKIMIMKRQRFRIDIGILSNVKIMILNRKE